MRKFLHYSYVMVFFVLLVSGFLLHLSVLRGLLSAYRRTLIFTHASAGELLGILTVTYGVYLVAKISFWWERPRYRAGVILFFLAMSSWIFSGWVLLNKAEFGPVFTTYSFEMHRWLAYLAVPALLFHLWSVGAAKLTEKLSPSRRRFFGWVTAGAGSAWLGALLWRFWGPMKTQNIRGDENCDVFQPVPEPAAESLPPKGGGLQGKFGEYSIVNFLPCLHHDTWRFTIDGLVERPVTFRWEDFVRLPRTVQVSDFHCVEGWSVFDITYEGLKVPELLTLCGIRPEAKYVKFYSADGKYADALTLEQTLHMPDVMVALMMDGKPIPRVLGGPARLIVPQMYAYKAVKWVNRIELTSEPYLGYWEFHGFETDAWVGIY